MIAEDAAPPRPRRRGGAASLLQRCILGAHSCLTDAAIHHGGFYQSTKWQSCECPTAVHYVKKWPSIPPLESEEERRRSR